MIESIVLDYLSNMIEDVGVFMERPERPEKPYILLEKTGSSESNHIKSATIAVQSYGRSLLEAAQINEVVKAMMPGIVQLNTVSKCSLQTDYNFTNTATKEYRYQAVFSLVHY